MKNKPPGFGKNPGGFESLSALFKSKGLGGLIADLGRTVILDGAGVDVGSLDCPLGAMLFEVAEGLSVQLDQSLANDGLVGAVAALDVHHLGDGHTAGDPLLGGLGEVGNLGQIAGVAVADQHKGVVAQSIAVVGVKVGRESAAAFVAEEVMDGSELAVVGAGGLAGSQIVLDHLGEELLGLDERNLNVAVRVTLEEELLLNGSGQNGEDSHRLFGQTGFDESVLFSPGGQGVEGVGLCACQQLVDLGDQHGEFGNELHDALGDDGNAEVSGGGSAVCNGVGDVVGDLRQRHLLGSNFFTDQADVGLRLQRALQSHVGSGTTHDLDEVPVLLGGVGIAADVADDLAVGLGGGVKAEGALDVVVLQVAVDGLGAADDLNAGVVGGAVLSQNGGVGVGVVTADDDQRVDAVLFAVFGDNGELLLRLQLGAAGTDDVKTAGGAILIDIFVIEDDEIVVQQTTGTALETDQDVFGVGV